MGWPSWGLSADGGWGASTEQLEMTPPMKEAGERDPAGGKEIKPMVLH